MKTIGFRTDGNHLIGYGHFFRCLALAEMLNQDFDICFFVKNTPLSIINHYLNYRYNIIEASDDEIREVSVSAKPEEYKAMVLDGYAFNCTYQRKLREAGFNVVVIDDYATKAISAAAVINHAPNVTKDQYHTAEIDHFLLGPLYAILRKPFLRAALREREINRIDTAFICFGGMDSEMCLVKAATAATKSNVFTKIHVVVNDNHLGDQQFVQLVKDHPKLISTHQNLGAEDMVSLMQQCQLAVCPASTIAYELCSVGIGFIGGYFIDNQLNIYTGFKDREALFPVGDFTKISTSDLAEQINMYARIDHINTQIKKQKQLIDGRSQKRFRQAFGSI